ncbi:MAG: TetR/AcrR family transcriptional regulator, partial [Halocynthiibacter sp.]
TLGAILLAGQKSAEFDVPDTKLAALAIIAMITGVNTWFREGGRLSRDEIEEIYWDMVRKSVGA